MPKVTFGSNGMLRGVPCHDGYLGGVVVEGKSIWAFARSAATSCPTTQQHRETQNWETVAMSQVHLQDGRTLLIESTHASVEALGACLSERFVAMLPGFACDDQGPAGVFVTALIDLGCVEICCVGPAAKSLHDAIDWIVEEKGAIGVATTWHQDQSEGCEYFLLAAGGKSPSLVALVEDHPQLASMLRTMAAGIPPVRAS